MALALQRSFQFGEVAPAVAARADLSFYGQALRTCRNFVVQRHGSVANRPGTAYLASTKTVADQSVLFAAVFADDAAYVIEAGDLYFRFYRNGARVTVSGVTAWSNATAYVVGDLASRLGVNYYCILAHTNQQPPNATYWYTLTGTIFEIPTPYTIAQVSAVRMGGPATDTLTVVHPLHSVRELRRTAHTTWTLTTASFDPVVAAPTNLATSGAAGTAYNWVVTAEDLASGEESLVSASAGTSATPASGTPITLTWTAVSNCAYKVYRSERGKSYAFEGRALSNTFISIGDATDPAHTPPVSRSTIFSHGFDGNNEPRSITYYQQRQVFGGTENQPAYVAASRTGYRTNFTIETPIRDDASLSFKVVGRRFNVVRHVLEVGELFVLTSGTIWIAEGDADGLVLPSAINLRPQTYHGVSDTPPVIVGSTMIYVQAGGSLVRDLRPGQSVEVPTARYQSRDLTILSAHLFTGYTTDRLAFAETPHSIVWAVRSDGSLLGLTYLPDFDSFGWHRHDTGASGEFEDVVTVPEGAEDAVYVQVKRTINGATARYIERFASRVISSHVTDSKFLDCHVTFSGATTTVTGLDHLEGEAVWALVDGSRQGPFTVSGGAITLSQAGVTAGVVGLQITSQIELLDLDASGTGLRDQRKRIGGLALLVEASQPAEGLRAGPDTDHLSQFMPTVLPTYGSPAALFTGRLEMGVPSTWNAYGRLTIQNTDPTPICILAALPHGDLGG